MKIGQRVYHKGVQANGRIVEQNNKGEYGVEFFWAHYTDVPGCPSLTGKGLYGKNKYGDPDNRKSMWAQFPDLVPCDSPPRDRKHTVALVNKRITDKRLHLVAEIPYADEQYYTNDIVIRYGGNLNHYPAKLCINEQIVLDKYQQMQMLGENLVMRSRENVPANKQNWIIKPYRSCGGKNIRPASGDVARPGLDYYQERFHKVREFRTHTFLWGDNPVPFIQEKTIADPNQLCWNKKQGGGFRYVYDSLGYGPFLGTLDDDIREKMTAMSVEALKKLKYDSGGIDFGMDANGALKIFEVNSAMGLRERSLYTYKKMYWKLANIDINDYKRNRWA